MPRYLKKDSELGYVEDNAEIEYLKFNNMRHTILGCMLGDFDAEGRYVVDAEITQELISMRKYFVESVENIDICISELKLDKQINFAITFEGNRATLSLLEKLNYEANFKINSGAYSNINEYILDEIETSGVVDKNLVYKRWNVGEYSGSVLDVFNMDDETLASMYGIVNRFKYLMKANQILLEREEKIEAIETNHIIATLELIKRYPKLKRAVDEKLKQELVDKKQLLCIDKPNFAKTLNEVVTQVVEGNLSSLDENEKKDFDTEKHNINNEYNIKISEAVEFKSEHIEEKNNKYDKIVLDTKGAERNQTITEVARDFVQEQQQATIKAQENANAVRNSKTIGAVNVPDINIATLSLIRYVAENIGFKFIEEHVFEVEKKPIIDKVATSPTVAKTNGTATNNVNNKGTSAKGGTVVKKSGGGDNAKKPTNNVKKGVNTQNQGSSITISGTNNQNERQTGLIGQAVLASQATDNGGTTKVRVKIDGRVEIDMANKVKLADSNKSVQDVNPKNLLETDINFNSDNSVNIEINS